VRAGVHNLSDNGVICKLIARPAPHGSAPTGAPRADCGDAPVWTARERRGEVSRAA